MFTNGETVTWHRAIMGETDGYGRPITTFEDLVLEDVAVAPGSSSEPRRASRLNQLEVNMTIYLVEDPGVTEADEFTVRGKRYTVEGEVGGGWGNPFTGTSFGTEIRLRRDTG